MPSKIKIRDRETGDVTVHLAATANEILALHPDRFSLADAPKRPGPKPGGKVEPAK
jgi:hypothetical protein